MWSYADVTCQRVSGGSSGARCKNPTDAKKQPATSEAINIKKSKIIETIENESNTKKELMSERKKKDGAGTKNNNR